MNDGDLDLDEFRRLIGRVTSAADVPQASELVNDIPVYDSSTFESVADDPVARRTLMAEIISVLVDGAGVMAIRQAVPDRTVLDAATAAFFDIIDREKRAGKAPEDHFARPGDNDRVWNTHEKLCLYDPDLFARYYSSTTIATVCEAYLGPGYQLTAQVNVVNPGGKAQSPHRDYHLGFLEPAQTYGYARHVHQMSQLLTLQGAVVHTDTPIEAGPTKVLPFSQHFDAGFAAYTDPRFVHEFEQSYRQVPLSAGDVVFFNPALFHAAGENRTSDLRRMNNLLQISSAFGRAMEFRDTDAMCRAAYPAMQRLAAGDDRRALENVIAAAAEGYAFPTSLDTDPNVGGLAPKTQADLVRTALTEGWSSDALDEALTARSRRMRARD